MDTPSPESDLQLVREAIFTGQKIQAIKHLREFTGLGLAEAKAEVERMELELRASAPDMFTVPPPGKGCSAVWVIGGAVLGGAVIGALGWGLWH